MNYSHLASALSTLTRKVFYFVFIALKVGVPVPIPPSAILSCLLKLFQKLLIAKYDGLATTLTHADFECNSMTSTDASTAKVMCPAEKLTNSTWVTPTKFCWSWFPLTCDIASQYHPNSVLTPLLQIDQSNFYLFLKCDIIVLGAM